MLLSFDVLTTTASDLRELLEAGSTTSKDIVITYLEQIERHNHDGAKLHVMISLAPKEELIRIADTLDAERQCGRVRGPLHGIPIIVKVSSL